MITKGGLYHQPKSNYSYGYDDNTLHLRVRGLKGEIKKATCIIGDPYNWEQGGAGGNLEAAGALGWKHATYEMKLEVSTDYHDYYFVEISEESKRSRYAFILESDNEKILYGERRIIDLANHKNDWALTDISNFYCFPYLNSIDIFKTPSWVKDTVWYQIFPDRFSNGDVSNDPHGTFQWGVDPTTNSYSGGDIQGVINKLDYLHDLGVTGIHFCPLFKGDTNHKYQTTNYMEIDPMFGSNALFGELVDKAHEKGIKVMLDAVFNHVGINHPFFQDLVEKGQASAYKDWFNIKSFPIKYGSYETFATVGEMPRVNLECKAAKDYFIEVGKFWIEEFGIDGWRLDVANEITHDFWKTFRSELKQLKEDLYIVGEVWHDARPWIQGDQYDAVMHYPLTDACIRYFAKNEATKEDFINYTNNLLVNYQRNAVESSYNLLNSHDTSRFLYEAGGDIRKMLLAYAYIFTQPGCPALYYGDEVGLNGEKGIGIELHRRCMEWDVSKWNMKAYTHIKKLIQLRKDLKVTSSELAWIKTNHDHVIAYIRGNMLMVINNLDSQVEARLEVDAFVEACDLVNSGYLMDDVTDLSEENQQLLVKLNPLSYCVFSLRLDPFNRDKQRLISVS